MSNREEAQLSALTRIIHGTVVAVFTEYGYVGPDAGARQIVKILLDDEEHLGSIELRFPDAEDHGYSERDRLTITIAPAK
jgi:hypothetical protein